MPEGGIHQMKQGHSVFHGCLHRRIWVVSRRGLFSATEAKLGGGHNCSPESFEIMVYVSPMCAVMDTKKLMLKLASVLYESLWRKNTCSVFKIKHSVSLAWGSVTKSSHRYNVQKSLTLFLKQKAKLCQNILCLHSLFSATCTREFYGI